MSNGAAELIPVLPAHRFDEDALVRYLRDLLPGFDGAVEIQQFQGGQSNPTFHVHTGAGDYVVRKKPPGVLLPRAHAVDREYRAMTALADTDVPVPRTRVLCTDESVIGTAFFVMDHVPGRIFPDRVMREGTPDERAAIYADVARVLAALHDVDWRAVGLGDFGRPDNYLQRQVARWTGQWQAADLDGVPAMDRLAAWLSENLPTDSGEATIAHGDYRLGNVIIHPTQPRIVAVLDWELATIGDPLADLGYLCLTYHFPGDQDPRSGIAGEDLSGTGIPTQQALVNSYCRHAGRDVPPLLDHYIVFSMFRLASIAAGVWRRGVEGNAADSRAVGDLYRIRCAMLADGAYELAESIS